MSAIAQHGRVVSIAYRQPEIPEFGGDETRQDLTAPRDIETGRIPTGIQYLWYDRTPGAALHADPTHVSQANSIIP